MALIYAVEDDKNILEIEMFALKNSGYQVEGFECAHDFYKKLEEKQPDLVLLDIMLPDEDGLEIVAKLRRRPETKKLPVIMVTAKSTGSPSPPTSSAAHRGSPRLWRKYCAEARWHPDGCGREVF